MAVYEILPTTNLKWDDIRDTLNANGGNVNNSAVTAFQSSANINKWSKYKPVRLNQPFPSYDTYWKAQNGYCGLVPAKCGADWISDIQTLEWEYELPRGGESESYRLGDYRGYSPKALPQYTPSFPASAYSNDSFDILFRENASDNVNYIPFSDLTDYLNKDFYIGAAVKVTSKTGTVNYSYGTSESVSKGGNLSVRIDTKASWFQPGVTCTAFCFLTDQAVFGGKIPSNAMIYAYPDSPLYKRSANIIINTKPTYESLFEVTESSIQEEYNLIRFTVKAKRLTTTPVNSGSIYYSYNIATEYGEQWTASEKAFASGDVTITAGSGSTGAIDTVTGIIRLPTTVYQNYDGLITLTWNNGVKRAALGGYNVKYKR